MNRIEFMRQLESLLQNISPTERAEALQYYNDYFNDAGVENEQDVIEALGNPAKVAETIKKDLYGNGSADLSFQRDVPDNRAVVEYNKTEDRNAAEKEEQPETAGQNRDDQQDSQDNPFKSAMNVGSFDNKNDFGFGSSGTQGGFADNGSSNQSSYGSTNGYAYGNSTYNNTSYGYQSPVEPKKMSGTTIALIVIACIVLGPVAFSLATGLLGTLLGLAAGWFGMILGFGITAVVLLIAGLVLAGFGVAGLFVSPLGGIGMIGAGLLCGGIGILFMMLTVAMVGIATPAIFHLFRVLWQKLFRKKKYA